jgi:hypothetical protein
MKNNNMSLDEFDKILTPKTPAEYAATLAMWTSRNGFFTEKDLEDLKASDQWRSKIEKFRGRDFCSCCSQLIPSNYCRECGLSLPALLPDILDLIPAPSLQRTEIEKTATEFIKAPVKPKMLLGFLHFLNKSSDAPLQDEDVNTIFVEACRVELLRRKAA